MHGLPLLLSLLRMQAEAAPEPALAPAPVAAPAPAPVPAPVPPPAPDRRDAFSASIAASAAGGLGRQGDSTHGQTGDAQLGIDWYLRRPVVDDGTPPGLQAYLQRADHLSLDVRGALSRVRSDDPADIYRLTDYGLRARLAGLFYRDWAVFGGEIEYSGVWERLSYPAPGAAVEGLRQRGFLRPSVTAGIRDRGFELRLTYLAAPYSRYPLGSSALPQVELAASYFGNPRWGQGLAVAKLAVNASSILTLTAFTLADGGGGSAKYELFVNPRLGIWLAGDYQTEEVDIFEPPGYFIIVGYMIAHAEVGVEWWRSNRFALIGSLGGRMTRVILQDRSPYGSETPYLELLANIGIVGRVRGHRTAADAAPAE